MASNEPREHYFISLPHADMAHSMGVCIGQGCRENSDNTEIYIKTNASCVAKYKMDNPGVTDEMIFPTGQTEQVDEATAETRLQGAKWMTPNDY